MTDIEKLRRIFIDALDPDDGWLNDGYDNPFRLDGAFDLDKAIGAVVKELVASHLASEGQWIEITGKQNEEIERMRTMLTQRFMRSSPIEEALLAAGVGKRPLPSAEECLAWGAKLGIPDEFRAGAAGGD